MCFPIITVGEEASQAFRETQKLSYIDYDIYLPIFIFKGKGHPNQNLACLCAILKLSAVFRRLIYVS